MTPMKGHTIMFARTMTMIGLLVGSTALGTAAFAADHSVALVLGVNGSPFYEALACGASDEAKKLGLTLNVSAPSQFAADQQVPVVDAVTARHPAVAVIVPTDSQALVAPMRALAKSGVDVVTADQTLNDTSFLKAQIETDNLLGGKLAADEMTEYRQPFLDPKHREPVFRFPNELPIAGTPDDVYALAVAYHDWLLKTEVPKLFFHAAPGIFIPPAQAAFYRRHLKSCRSVDLGQGLHYLQEDHPDTIGTEIAAWLGELDLARV